jgi:hypothetical protein
VSRLKRLGERLAAHDPARQVAEVQVRCAILNTYNRLGMRRRCINRLSH